MVIKVLSFFLILRIISSDVVLAADEEEIIIFDDEDEDNLSEESDESDESEESDESDESEESESNSDVFSGTTQFFEHKLEKFKDRDWFDPPGQFWKPRQGARWEAAIYLGPEAALGSVSLNDFAFPSVGGGTLTLVGRYYPIDHMALIMGSKLYTGLNQPAAGTAAESVLTPYFGVRYDLLKEYRLSLLVDVMSGPAFFFFAGQEKDLSFGFSELDLSFAVGGELSSALVLCYALGPTVFETRLLVGGRAGSAQDIQGDSAATGPFSSMFIGLDFGVTFSLLEES